MHKISVIGNGLVGKAIEDSFHNVTVYSRHDTPQQHHHDILVVAAPGGSRVTVEANPDKDMLDCYQLVQKVTDCSYNYLIHISSRDVMYDTVYGTNRKVLETMILRLENSVAMRIGKALAPGLTRNILSDIKNKTWLDKINLDNTDQWYPIVRLLEDANSLFVSNCNADFFLSKPILNRDIVKKYKPKLLATLEKNSRPVASRDTKHSTGVYVVPEQDVWQIFDTYFLDT
jgi:hypothetical protein